MKALTGANGRLGRAVAQALAKLGLTEDIVLITRDRAQVSDLAEQGFDIREADYDEPGSLERALQDVERVLMVSATGPASVRIPLHRKAIDAIVRTGVPHVVYTSRVEPSARSPYPFAAIHEDSEQRLRESGVIWTFLRNNEYAENLAPWLQEAVTTGEFRFGAEGPIAFIARADVVEAVVTTLTTEGHDGRIYDLSGPEALDRNGLATVLGEAIGSTVRAAGGSREDYGRLLELQGRPDFIVEMGMGLYDASAAGEWAGTTPAEVEQLLGHRPVAVSDYIRANFAPGC
jgi:NAD(P)H dehydrogenase (quinone)